MRRAVCYGTWWMRHRGFHRLYDKVFVEPFPGYCIILKTQSAELNDEHPGCPFPALQVKVCCK
ncbi:hypothetical protein ACNKHU_13935 [Shigella flexneri]